MQSIAFSYASYYFIAQVETDIGNMYAEDPDKEFKIMSESANTQQRFNYLLQPAKIPGQVVDVIGVSRNQKDVGTWIVIAVDFAIALTTTILVVIIVKFAKRGSSKLEDNCDDNICARNAIHTNSHMLEELIQDPSLPIPVERSLKAKTRMFKSNIKMCWEFLFYLLQETFHVTMGYVWDHFFSELFFRKLESDNGSAATLITFLRFVRTAIWFAVFPSVGLRLMRQVNEVGGYDQSWAECTREVLAKAVIAMLAYSITLSVYGLCMYYLAARTSNGVGLGCLYGYAVVVTVWGAVVTQSTWWHAKCKAHADKGDTAFQTFWELQIGWLVSYAVWYPVAFSLDLMPSTGNLLWMSIGIVLVVALSIFLTSLWLLARHIKSEYVSGRLSISSISAVGGRLSLSSLIDGSQSPLASLLAHAASPSSPWPSPSPSR
eukprot:c10485_g1_i4.p1 GENE.c10485_g1_i4~~c10485_g1_i4.p1  ORF type:complete len:433 (+),score=103.65 c10485_g1_i4:396-1694(+)